jgi:hypothetical protein
LNVEKFKRFFKYFWFMNNFFLFQKIGKILDFLVFFDEISFLEGGGGGGFGKIKKIK